MTSRLSSAAPAALTAAITAVAVLGAGCASTVHSARGAAGYPRRARSVRAASAHPCSLITASQIGRVMGHPFPRPRPQSVGAYDQCFGQDSAGAMVSVAVPPPPDGSRSWAGFRLVRRTSAAGVAGLGGPAFCYPLGSAGHMISVLKGSVLVEVGADSCAHAKAIARLVLARL